ncbi:MAG TPA: 50S ribosomal protein L25 [Symbiobacteriaceae bacterium]|nr:50S ribosomal protein L25 [Symbiobacteriaceae bacterium]
MRSSLLLNLEPRKRATVYQLRSKGMVPGVLYGPDRDPEPVQMPLRALQAALREGATHKPVTIQFGPTGPRQYVLVKDVQRDTFTQVPMHVDLLLIAMDHAVTAEIPIRLLGEDRLILRHIIVNLQLHAVKAEALPDDLPDAIEIDVGHMRPGTTLLVADLSAPPGVKLVDEPNQMVLALHQTRKTAEEEISVR